MPDRDKAAREKEAIARKEGFTRIIKENFHGSSEAVQKLIEFGGNEISEYDRGIYAIDIHRSKVKMVRFLSDVVTRLIFASEEKEMWTDIFLVFDKGPICSEFGIKDIQEIKFSENSGHVLFLTPNRGFSVSKNGRIVYGPLSDFKRS